MGIGRGISQGFWEDLGGNMRNSLLDLHSVLGSSAAETCGKPWVLGICFWEGFCKKQSAPWIEAGKLDWALLES